MHLILVGDVNFKNSLVGFCCEKPTVPRTALGETGEETILNYLNMRNTLLQEGQLSLDDPKRTVSKSCTNCVNYHKTKQKPSKMITYVGFSPYPAPCNAKCIYCASRRSIKYGFTSDEEESFLKVFDALEYAQTHEMIFPDAIFFVAPGKISIHPHKQRIINMVKNNAAMFGTNCIVFDEQIAKNLTNNPKSQINLSIDCGTKETWRKIKGADNFGKVKDNLFKYRENCANADQIKLKYIVMPGINDNIKDFIECIELAKSLGVSSITISRDHTKKYAPDSSDSEQLMKSASMFVMMLRYNGLKEIILGEYTPVQIKRIQELSKSFSDIKS